MRIKFFLASLVLASTFGVAPSYADVIFSTFGPGNSYNPGAGATILGANSSLGSFDTIADEFASPGDYAVGQIDVALGWISGTDSATVRLWTESGGLPSVQLGSWTISGMGSLGTNAITSITGITGINLTSGSNYFLQIEAADDAWEAWNDGTNGVNGTVVQDLGSGWTAYANQAFSAFDILSATATPAPEPITLSMFGAGLLGLSAVRRRKKAA